MVKNLPAKAESTSLALGWVRFHRLGSNEACAPQLSPSPRARKLQLGPAVRNQRSQHSETPAHHSQGGPCSQGGPRSQGGHRSQRKPAARASPRTARKTQHGQKRETQMLIK